MSRELILQDVKSFFSCRERAPGLERSGRKAGGMWSVLESKGSKLQLSLLG